MHIENLMVHEPLVAIQVLIVGQRPCDQRLELGADGPLFQFPDCRLSDLFIALEKLTTRYLCVPVHKGVQIGASWLTGWMG